MNNKFVVKEVFNNNGENVEKLLFQAFREYIIKELEKNTKKATKNENI